jgi:hypothetical protein
MIVNNTYKVTYPHINKINDMLRDIINWNINIPIPYIKFITYNFENNIMTFIITVNNKNYDFIIYNDIESHKWNFYCTTNLDVTDDTIFDKEINELVLNTQEKIINNSQSLSDTLNLITVAVTKFSKNEKDSDSDSDSDSEEKEKEKETIIMEEYSEIENNSNDTKDNNMEEYFEPEYNTNNKNNVIE